MSLKAKTEWIVGLDDQEKKKMVELLAINNKVLDKLREIVYNTIKNDEKVKSTDYSDPSWSHKQAHLNGRADMARYILNLLEIKES